MGADLDKKQESREVPSNQMTFEEFQQQLEKISPPQKQKWLDASLILDKQYGNNKRFARKKLREADFSPDGEAKPDKHLALFSLYLEKVSKPPLTFDVNFQKGNPKPENDCAEKEMGLAEITPDTANKCTIRDKQGNIKCENAERVINMDTGRVDYCDPDGLAQDPKIYRRIPIFTGDQVTVTEVIPPKEAADKMERMLKQYEQIQKSRQERELMQAQVDPEAVNRRLSKMSGHEGNDENNRGRSLGPELPGHPGYFLILGAVPKSVGREAKRLLGEYSRGKVTEFECKNADGNIRKYKGLCQEHPPDEGIPRWHPGITVFEYFTPDEIARRRSANVPRASGSPEKPPRRSEKIAGKERTPQLGYVETFRDIERKYPGFLAKLAGVAREIGANPAHLSWLIWCESTGNSKAVNFQRGDSPDPLERARKGRAVGLIQWMGFTAEKLGTTSEALYWMTPLEQLDYVRKYFAGCKNLDTYEKIYFKVFFPIAQGKPDSYVLRTKSTSAQTIFAQNLGIASKEKRELYKKHLLPSEEQYLTAGDFRAYLIRKGPPHLDPSFFETENNAAETTDVA